MIISLFLLAGYSANSQGEYSDTTVVVEAPEEDEESYDDKRLLFFLPTWGYSTDSVMLRRLPDSLVTQWKKDKAFWYADSVFRNTGREEQQRTTSSPPPERRRNNNRQKEEPAAEYKSPARTSGFEMLLLAVVIGGFLAFILYYLISNKGLFRKERKVVPEETNVEEEEDIFAINYQKEIDKAASAGNYRLAIRLMYLRLLKNLAEKNIIQYKQDRTNLDYLMQLISTTYYNDFFRITRNYEYSWYGHFEVDAEKYRLIRNDIENFKPGLV